MFWKDRSTGHPDTLAIVRPPNDATVLAATTDGSISWSGNTGLLLGEAAIVAEWAHQDEYPEEAARRELAEENGLRSKELRAGRCAATLTSVDVQLAWCLCR